MLVTQVDNRRLRKARRLMDLRMLRVQSIQNQPRSGLADKYIRIEAYNALRSAQVRFAYLLDQQSARLARYLSTHCNHRIDSYAGVPKTHCITSYESLDDGHIGRHPHSRHLKGDCRWGTGPNWIAVRLFAHRHECIRYYGTNWTELLKDTNTWVYASKQRLLQEVRADLFHNRTLHFM